MTKKNEELPFYALSQGYILLPKALLKDSFFMANNEFSYLEAFLMLLCKVNYKDDVVTIRGYKFECKRGETAISFLRWGTIFGWGRHKTRSYFTKIEKMNLIRIVPTERDNICIIKIVDYDLWTSKPREDWTQRKSKSEELFEVFWNQFHEVTQTPKRDIGSARREWKKLTVSEKNTAIKSIYPYYMGLEDTRFIKRACNYLRDKSFLNEEIY